MSEMTHKEFCATCTQCGVSSDMLLRQGQVSGEETTKCPECGAMAVPHNLSCMTSVIPFLIKEIVKLKGKDAG